MPTSFFLVPIFLLNSLSVPPISQQRQTLTAVQVKGTSLSSLTRFRLLLWEVPPLKFLGYYQIEAALNLPGFLFRCMCQEQVEEKNTGPQLSKVLALSFIMNSELRVIHLQARMNHPSSFFYLLYPPGSYHILDTWRENNIKCTYYLPENYDTNRKKRS